MKEIKSVRINGDPIHLFDCVMYIFDNENGKYFLHLDLIVTEVEMLKYRFNQEVRVSIKYNNGKEQNLTMLVQGTTEIGNAEIPILELCVDIDNPEDFQGIKIVNWETPIEEFSLRNDILIEEIRKIDMPNKNVEIQATLPIDLQEWVYSNSENISEILKEALIDYINKK
ncbi:hypothetical protein FB550_1026 [Neobacillus bataviensis]|uniref:Uncharacterized protein n=1 Tax=Neobacillus bataviensis TaxID=220685 RepID=A0A561DRI9_9BACI|nr:hypothetical protein [Neobacillus bataviensis]TWE05991.1 hypothetical protein FB550_1026 [Neobacillus bataviensis]